MDENPDRAPAKVVKKGIGEQIAENPLFSTVSEDFKFLFIWCQRHKYVDLEVGPALRAGKAAFACVLGKLTTDRDVILEALREEQVMLTGIGGSGKGTETSGRADERGRGCGAGSHR